MGAQIYIAPQDVDQQQKDALSLLVSGTSNLVVLNENHTMESEVCSQTLENGVSIFDHIALNPDVLEVTIHCSNVDQQSKARFPAQFIYSKLKKLRSLRLLCVVDTLYERYENMAIRTISIPNEAPFVGRSDIVVNFVRVDRIDDVKNNFKYELYSPAKISKKQEGVDDATADEKKQDEASEEVMPDRKNKEPEPLFSEESSAGDAETTSGTNDKSKTAQKTIDTIKSRVAAVQKNASAQLSFIQSKMLMVSDFVGRAQSLILNVSGQVLGLDCRFDCLCREWRFRLTDARGQDMVTDAVFTPGQNCLRGLHPVYTSIDASGQIVSEDCILKAIYIIQSSANAIKQDVAFNQNPQTGIAPCSIIFVTDQTAVDIYDSLFTDDRELNFSLDEMGYTVR